MLIVQGSLNQTFLIELGLIIYNTVVAACAFDFVLLIMRTDLMLLKELKVNPHFPII